MELKVEGLRVKLRGNPVLRGVELAVERGEFVSLLGPSGCGKSTLLKAIAGFVPLEGGSIRIGGQEVSGLAPHRRGVVILFQDIRLFPHLTVEENVAFPLKMQRVGRRERLEAARELLRRVQMEGYGGRPSGQLSGGQQQRVALARALAAKPRLLLLDEPFSALDENLRGEMRALVLGLHREFGTTTLLVTHDREEALSMSRRVAVLFDGAVAQCGTPREVYAAPASRRVADYFGDCVYLPGEVREGVFFCPALTLPAGGRRDGRWELMLRSRALHPELPGEYPAQVVGIQFQGAQTVVAFQGEEGALWRLGYPGDPGFEVGQRLRCRLDPREGVLFEAER